MPNMDWKKETTNNPVYPNATYKVQLESTERVRATTGTMQIRWKAKILQPEEHAGRTIIDHTALTEKSLWRVANMVSGWGVDTSKLETMDTDSHVFDQVLQACQGRVAFWRNEQGLDPKGNKKNNIVEYAPDPNQSVLEFITEMDAPGFVQ
jgi:hypothetical protein